MEILYSAIHSIDRVRTSFGTVAAGCLHGRGYGQASIDEAGEWSTFPAIIVALANTEQSEILGSGRGRGPTSLKERWSGRGEVGNVVESILYRSRSSCISAGLQMLVSS